MGAHAYFAGGTIKASSILQATSIVAIKNKLMKLSTINLPVGLAGLTVVIALGSIGCAQNRSSDSSNLNPTVPMTGNPAAYDRNYDKADAPPSQPLDDSSIRMHVIADLNDNADYKFEHVSVTVANGIVQLDGTVDTADHKSMAGQLAGKVGGVSNIVNNLTVSM